MFLCVRNFFWKVANRPVPELGCGDTTYLIIGIDAGIKVGYAAIDLNGRLVAAGTEKEANDERIVSVIRKAGMPILIATDVTPAPFFVKKIAARFNAKVYKPRKSFSVAKKRVIGRNIFDPHIRDAYAAAIKAYRKYANRFRRIEKLYPEKAEYYKMMVLKGKAVGKIAKIK